MQLMQPGGEAAHRVRGVGRKDKWRIGQEEMIIRLRSFGICVMNA